MDEEKLQEDIAEVLTDELKGLVGEHSRKSKPSAGGGGRDDDEHLSICKTLLGAMHDDWTHAEKEKETWEEAQKADGTEGFSEYVGAAGGFFLQPQIAGRVIKRLRSNNVMRSQLNPEVITLPAGVNTAQIPKEAGDANAYWLENQEDMEPLASGEYDADFLQVVLRTLGAFSKVPNQLINQATKAADNIVERAIANAMADKEEHAFFFGSGNLQPLGIMNHPDIQTITLSEDLTFDDLIDAQTAVEEQDGVYEAWVMHPRSKGTVRKIENPDGEKIWSKGMDADEPDTLLGSPIHYTTNFPTDVTVGSRDSTSPILLLNSRNFAIAQGGKIAMDASSKGGGFQYNQTWYRGIRRVSCAVRHPEEFVKIEGVQS